MIQIHGRTLIEATVILSALLSATAIGAPNRMPLQPEATEHVGEFCHTGTVTMACHNYSFALESRDGRRHFVFAEEPFGVRPGDIIAVEGIRLRHDNDAVHERVCKVRRLGHVAPPPPKEVPLSELVKRDHLYRQITTEGTLVQARRDEVDNRFLQLLVKDGATVFNAAAMADTNQMASISSLLGARLRMTGFPSLASGVRRNIAPYLSINATNGLEVVRPPPDDIFAAPEFDFDSRWTPGEIVGMDMRRFEGVVAATWGGDQLMVFGRDFHRVKATLSRPDELPAAGDSVVVVGFPDTDLYGVNLIYARCKTLPSKRDFGVDLKPADATLRQLMTDANGRPRINGYSHGRLLRIRGVVLDLQPSLALFSLNDDGLTMPIDCSSAADALPRLEPNSRIEAVVLAVTETDSWRESLVLPQTRGLRLILRSGADLKILARPPWWTPARLTAAVISLLVIIVLIIAANRIINRIMMRRKVSERTRLAVELHDSLSQTLAGVACQIAAGHDAIDEDPQSARELLGTAERMLESSRTELKNCLYDLRNDTVDDPDFARAIRKTLTGLESDSKISIRFHAARSQMTDTTAHAVLCIIRELVANAIRHGAATRIRVAGAADGRKLRFSVRDNGSGFDTTRRPGPREGHFGLSGIHERLADMGGEFSIESDPQNGTKALVTIRLKTSDARHPKSAVRSQKSYV